MAKLQERIKERRLALNLTLLEVAEQIGVKEATMQRYESGEIKNVKHETIVKLAKIFNCTPQYLMGWSDNVSEPKANSLADENNEKKDNLTVLPQKDVYMRPLYNSVAAGFGAPAENTIMGYIPTYISNSFEKDKYIWVNVEGDSMSPLIDHGSKILIRMQDNVDSGQIAVVLIDGEEAVVKKVKYGADYCSLISINPYYPPRVFKGKEINDRVRVVGLVKEVSKSLQ